MGSSTSTNCLQGDELIVLTRNSPTTYFFDAEDATGFDYELVHAYAQSRGLTLRIKLAFTLEDLLAMLANGEGHLAAAGTDFDPRTKRAIFGHQRLSAAETPRCLQKRCLPSSKS